MHASLALEPSVASPVPELLHGGEAAFRRILERIGTAQRSILIRCFDWRDDETGELVARHLLAAADRGAEAAVLKDRVGGTSEYLEGTRRTVFQKEIDFVARIQTAVLRAGSGRWGSFR